MSQFYRYIRVFYFSLFVILLQWNIRNFKFSFQRCPRKLLCPIFSTFDFFYLDDIDVVMTSNEIDDYVPPTAVHSFLDIDPTSYSSEF